MASKEIKFAFPLADEQKEAKKLIIENEIIIITGNPGSGKTSIVSQACLDLLFKREINKIFVARPTVEVGKSLGLLPGTLQEKVNPYTEVFIQSMKDVYNHPDKIDKILQEGIVELFPIQFIRGKNIKSSQVLVVEESQNTTRHEMEAILTRHNSNSRIILIGDLKQRDISGQSGLELAIELSKSIEGIKHIHLKENHRSGLVKEIIDYLYKMD